MEVFSTKESPPMNSNTSFVCGLQTQYNVHLVQTNFLPQNHVNIQNSHCEWPNIVSEARIEPLFAETGQKLTSVDQKLVMVMM